MMKTLSLIPQAHAAASTSQTKPKKKPKWNDEANHGRYGFDDYPGLETVVLSHKVLHPGDACPHCQEANQTGEVIGMTRVH